MKRGGPDHPKTYALAEVLGIRRRDAVGLLEMLFHFTSQYAPRGDIGKYSDKRIAAAVDWTRQPARLIEGLIKAGWIEHHPEVRIVVHDWEDHADRTTLQRLSRNGQSAVSNYQQVTGKLCIQSESKIRTPPVPEPEPVPIPEPVPHHSRQNGMMPQQPELGVILVPASVLEFREWIKPWERCKDPSEVADIWKIVIATEEDRKGAFESRDRYLASDDVARNIWISPERFLAEQKKAKWQGRWPAAKRGNGDKNQRRREEVRDGVNLLEQIRKER